MLTYRVTVFQPEKPEEVKRERKNHDEIIWSRTQNVYHDGRHSRIFLAPCGLWKYFYDHWYDSYYRRCDQWQRVHEGWRTLA
jgi:hypothetical protein